MSRWFPAKRCAVFLLLSVISRANLAATPFHSIIYSRTPTAFSIRLSVCLFVVLYVLSIFTVFFYPITPSVYSCLGCAAMIRSFCQYIYSHSLCETIRGGILAIPHTFLLSCPNQVPHTSISNPATSRTRWGRLGWPRRDGPISRLANRGAQR